MKFFTNSMLEYVKQYPKVFKLGWLSSSDYVVSDIKLIKEILIERANDMPNHADINQLKIWHLEKIPTTKSLISIRDDEWKQRRKAMSPSFNTTKTLSFLDTFSKKSDLLCEILSEVGYKTVDIHLKFANMTVDVLGETVFGTQFNTQRDPTNKLAKSVESFIVGMGRLTPLLFFPYWYKYPIHKIQNFLSSIDNLMDLCRQVVQQRKKFNETHHNDLLQVLLELSQDIENEILPDSLLFLVAGHETTSNLLSWTTYLITQHPEVEEKISEEIKRVLGEKGEISSDNIQSLEYIDCVIQESLRLYPPAMITNRQTNVPLELDGIQFPKDTTFTIPIWAIHHNDQYWPDPEKFDPTRFDSEHKHNIHPFSWIPFGGGPRICIGMKFALFEAKVALVKIYRQFSLKFVGSACNAKFAGGLLRPESVPVKVVKK